VSARPNTNRILGATLRVQDDTTRGHRDVPLQVEGIGDVEATASVHPTVFYPVVDKYFDRIDVTGGRDESASVRTHIAEVATGTTVFDHMTDAGTGDYRMSWSGILGGTGALAPAGEYDVRVTLTDAEANTKVIVQRITLSHDWVTWEKKTVAKDGKRISLWGWSKDARISFTKSSYRNGVRLISNRGFATVIYTFPVSPSKIYGWMSFDVYGKSPNRHKALLAIWNPKLGGFKSLANYDATKKVGPRLKWWKDGTQGQGRKKDGKVRAAVMVWKGLGGAGKSVFDVKRARLTYKVGTLHSASGAALASEPVPRTAAGVGGRSVGDVTTHRLPDLRRSAALEPNDELLPIDDPLPTEEPPVTEAQPVDPDPDPTAKPTEEPRRGPKESEPVTPNQRPSADAGGPYHVDEGDTVKLDGTGSSDADGRIVSYEWTKQKRLDDATRKRPRFEARDDGILEIDLTVTDDQGASDTATARIRVGNVDPELGRFGPFKVRVGEALVLYAIEIHDPGRSDTHEVSVDWGDGSSSTADIGEDGRVASAEHTYTDPGRYEVRATVTDDDGGTGSRRTFVSVAAVPVHVPTPPKPKDAAD
jgi:hypothetical protein